MFFRRGAGRGAGGESAQAALVTSERSSPLPADAVRRGVDPAWLDFATTAELKPLEGMIGQDRALAALQFGTDMTAPDFNIFVLGPPATGKLTAVKAHLARKYADAPPPPAWVYVDDFENPSHPKALQLPHGRARALARGMEAAIDELRIVLPARFESDDYQTRRRVIDESFRSGQNGALAVLTARAEQMGIAVVRTQSGIAMAPMFDGKVVKPELFAEMPESVRREVERKIGDLQQELEALAAKAPRLDKERRDRLAALNDEFAHGAVRSALEEVAAAFADVPAVIEHLEAAGRDLIRHVALFLPAAGETGEGAVVTPADTARDPRFRRYLVNVMANGDGAEKGAPVCEEFNPTAGNLIGRIEHIAHPGGLATDFLLIKPGALHRANGGCLLIDARRLVQSPGAWDALKRALRTREIRVEPFGEQPGPVTAPSLEPMPIPLDLRVVLFGDHELFFGMSRSDPDFGGLFKVQVDFDDAIDLDAANVRDFARLVASIVARYGLRPLDKGAVARVVEQAMRMAEDREKLSVEIGRIADLVREADYWAGKASRATTTREDIVRAVTAVAERSDRLRDRTFEAIDRGVIMIDTDGAKIAQVNGLSVSQAGDAAFGRPSRITASVRLGSGRVTDIESEARLSGPLHTKGVMILWGVLAGRYALDVPLSLAASLVFEQTYGGVDGDSASSAELYALLSALAEVPIRQSLAVTGSVNQRGEVQAIGGANEKIEGFFDICRKRGLDAAKGCGVLIPAANVQHLMLREDVSEAVAAGTFAIHAVSTIDQGIELLTGVAAGERGSDGAFPPGM